MRFTQRIAKPDILDSPYRNDGLSELERVIEHRKEQEIKAANGQKTSSFEFSRYKHADVKKLLDQMFHGKCAYCESFYSRTQPVDVEHFRPKNAVEKVVGKSGYWWLAMAWDNLLPSCIDCNRKRGQKFIKGFDNLAGFVGKVDFDRQSTGKSGKATSFPLRNPDERITDQVSPDQLKTEQRLLLDPTRDKPEEHLDFLNNIQARSNADEEDDDEPGRHRFNLISLVGARDADAPDNTRDAKMGLTSIQVYGLNRLGLVQARTKVLRELEFLLEMSIELEMFIARVNEKKGGFPETEHDFLDEMVDKLSELRQRIFAEIEHKTSEKSEYSAMAQSWLKEKIELLKTEVNQV